MIIRRRPKDPNQNQPRPSRQHESVTVTAHRRVNPAAAYSGAPMVPGAGLTRPAATVVLQLWRNAILRAFRAEFAQSSAAAIPLSVTHPFDLFGDRPVRLDIPYDDDSRDFRRQRRPDSETACEPKPLVDPGPLDRRVQQLNERAQENLFPEIPRREYKRKITSDDPKREPGERHVRSRRHLPRDLAGVRLRPEEKKVLAEVGRFRVVTVKDLAHTIYSGDERALLADLRYLEEKGLATLDRVNARRDGRRRDVERIDVVTLTADGERLARRDSEFVS